VSKRGYSLVEAAVRLAEVVTEHAEKLPTETDGRSVRDDLLGAAGKVYRVLQDAVGASARGFVECTDCSSKPGAPVLCPSCLANRETIWGLQETIRRSAEGNQGIAETSGPSAEAKLKWLGEVLGELRAKEELRSRGADPTGWHEVDMAVYFLREGAEHANDVQALRDFLEDTYPRRKVAGSATKLAAQLIKALREDKERPDTVTETVSHLSVGCAECCATGMLELSNNNSSLVVKMPGSTEHRMQEFLAFKEPQSWEYVGSHWRCPRCASKREEAKDLSPCQAVRCARCGVRERLPMSTVGESAYSLVDLRGWTHLENEWRKVGEPDRDWVCPECMKRAPRVRCGQCKDEVLLAPVGERDGVDEVSVSELRGWEFGARYGARCPRCSEEDRRG